MSTVMNNSKDNLQNRIYVSFDEQKVEWKLVVNLLEALACLRDNLANKTAC